MRQDKTGQGQRMREKERFVGYIFTLKTKHTHTHIHKSYALVYKTKQATFAFNVGLGYRIK